MEDNEDDGGPTLEQVLSGAVFSDKFRQYTARFTVPPFAAGALHFAASCAAMNPFLENACDPIFAQRHPAHIELPLLSTDTSTANGHAVLGSSVSSSASTARLILRGPTRS